MGLVAFVTVGTSPVAQGGGGEPDAGGAGQ
jgi:hypothetical protein